MDIRSLKPICQRDWLLIAAGAIAAIFLVVVLTSRYDYRTLPGGEYTQPTLMRIDHWTGSIARCIVTCIPVPDRK